MKNKSDKQLNDIKSSTSLCIRPIVLKITGNVTHFINKLFFFSIHFFIDV